MQIGQIIQALHDLNVGCVLIRHVKPFHVATNMTMVLYRSTVQIMGGKT